MSPSTLGTAGPHISAALTAARRGNGESMTPGPISPERKPALVELLRLVHATSQQHSPSLRKQIVTVLCELCWQYPC